MARIDRKGVGKGGDVLDESGNIVRRATTMRELAREMRKNMTKEERILWNVLRHNQLCGLQFYRQAAIDRYIVDFYCPRKRLVVEVDGGIHKEEDQQEHDEVRDEVLKERDLRILRVTNKEVLHDLENVLKKIARMCGRPVEMWSGRK